MAAQPSLEACALEAVLALRAFAVRGSDLVRKPRLAQMRRTVGPLVAPAAPLLLDWLHREIAAFDSLVANDDPRNTLDASPAVLHCSTHVLFSRGVGVGRCKAARGSEVNMTERREFPADRKERSVWAQFLSEVPVRQIMDRNVALQDLEGALEIPPRTRSAVGRDQRNGRRAPPIPRLR
jgi:hypothetical protein